jgi:hypothetical protein
MNNSNTTWKTQYQIIFDNTPKKLRKTSSQITNIKSQAKILVEMYFNN